MPVMMQNRFEDASKYQYLTFLISHTTTPLFGRECKVMVF
jgi:hypothetical protein